MKPAKIGPNARVERRRIRLLYVPQIQRPLIDENRTESKMTMAKPKAPARHRRRDSTSTAAKLLALRNEYKKLYVRPSIDEIPYNKKMVRKFDLVQPETVEQRARRNRSSETSRISRHCTKFIDNCVREERQRLEIELMRALRELLVAEDDVNMNRVSNGLLPIEFEEIWRKSDENFLR